MLWSPLLRATNCVSLLKLSFSVVIQVPLVKPAVLTRRLNHQETVETDVTATGSGKHIYVMTNSNSSRHLIKLAK